MNVPEDLPSDSSPTNHPSDCENLIISDLDSEDSKETVSEKQNNEEREKEVEEREKEVEVKKSESDAGEDMMSERTSNAQDIPRKRASDSSPSETPPGEHAPPPALPRKKRPNSETFYEASIHEPEQGGMNIEELVEFVRTMGRRGLYHDYAMIRSEPPAGTFDISK